MCEQVQRQGPQLCKAGVQTVAAEVAQGDVSYNFQSHNVSEVALRDEAEQVSR